MGSTTSKFRSFNFPTISNGVKEINPKMSLLTPIAVNITQLENSEEDIQIYEKGLSQAREEKYLNLKKRFSPLAKLLNKANIEMNAYFRLIENDSRETILRLGEELASVVIRNQLARYPELNDTIFEKALGLAANHEWMNIKAHPDDHDRIRSLLRKNNILSEASNKVSFISDPYMYKGGCLIETDNGVIDARLEQQLSTMVSEFKKMIRQNGNSVQNSEWLFDSCNNTKDISIPIKTFGYVNKVVGLVVEANGPAVQIGTICDIIANERSEPIAAEVLGFKEKNVLMMPLEEIRSIGPGSRVVSRQEKAGVAVGKNLLGRVIDGLGNPIDMNGPIGTCEEYPLYSLPINPLMRQRIRKPLDIGIRAINGLLTVGCGQRMGIFAGSGVGKSVLMGMIARNSSADVNVIALIGERGRELNDFIEKDLGPEGLKKSVVVVATSDHLPLVRVRGAFVATAIAEFFRDQGMTVNLMMDSLTRFAMAQREIGLALGEPPTTKGYTPSVFTMLPKLLERAGTSDHTGTITGLYTVLVEGDDMNEPIADAARSILDGHIVLTRDLASQNHYPAIDVMRSISRVMEDITALKHRHNAGRLKELLSSYRKAEDLINIGAYVSGSNPQIDRALLKIELINGYLRQNMDESVSFEESVDQLESIINKD